jgi:hypothetical protein
VLYPLFCIILAASYTMRANRLDEDFLGRALWREEDWTAAWSGRRGGGG